MKISDENGWNIKCISLNLTNICDLKCPWCYNETNKKAVLDKKKFASFFSSIISNGIEDITFTGGEPTLHPDFFGILELLKNKRVHLVSNGLSFSDIIFLNNCMKSNVDSLTISLKGYTKESFNEVTGSDRFDELEKAIRNLNSKPLHLTYTYIYDKKMSYQEFPVFTEFLLKNAINTIIISDLRPYYSPQGEVIIPKEHENLEALYKYLKCKGLKVFLRLNRPLCRYESQFIERTTSDNSVITQCAVKKRTGLFFSEELEVILCNAIDRVILGKYMYDFTNYKELKCFLLSEKVYPHILRLSGYPMQKCTECTLWEKCGGSCLLHWL